MSIKSKMISLLIMSAIAFEIIETINIEDDHECVLINNVTVVSDHSLLCSILHR